MKQERENGFFFFTRKIFIKRAQREARIKKRVLMILHMTTEKKKIMDICLVQPKRIKKTKRINIIFTGAWMRCSVQGAIPHENAEQQ